MKFNKTAIFGSFSASVAALLLSATAFAGCDDEGHKTDMDEKPAFEQLDTNLDGSITEAEAQDSWLAAAFQDVDADSNGLINRSEYESALS